VAVINRSVARRYARALLDLVETEATGVAEKLTDFAQLVESDRTLAQVLENPAFSLDERKRVLRRILEKLGWGAPLDRFYELLVERRRVAYLGAIAEEFWAMVDEREGRVRVKVDTAVELGGEAVERLRKLLADSLDKQVVVEPEVVPEALAGVAVRIGSLLIDGTMRSQIDRMRETLAKTRA
jgi:F-type H+-transporting ATPase subunit delta